MAFSDSTDDEVAYAPRLEGASGLKIVEFEKDSASTI